MSTPRTDTGSFIIVPEWLVPLVNGRALQVYCVLARHADSGTGECWPSRHTIGKRLGCSPNTVDRALNQLVKVGALTIHHRERDDGGRTSNLYTVLRSVPEKVNAAPLRPPVTNSATPPLPENEPPPLPENGAQNESQLEREPVERENPNPSSSPTVKTVDEQPDDDVDTQFEQFWNTYPSASPKGSKKNARRAFAKLTLDQRRAAYRWLNVIAAEAAKLGRATPHASTYLNGERWVEYEERDTPTPLQPPQPARHREAWETNNDTDTLADTIASIAEDHHLTIEQARERVIEDWTGAYNLTPEQAREKMRRALELEGVPV